MTILSLSLSLSLLALSLTLQDKGGDPCAVQARKIADRLKNIGDDLEEEYIKSKLDDLTAALGDVVMNTSLQSMLYAYSNLSWRKVAEIFKLLCRALETTCYNDQLSRTVFEKVWDSILDNSVVPWIQNRGGWVSPYTNYVVML